MLKLARVVRGCSPLRTLESLESDHQRFLEAGGDIKKAKEFNNVIGRAFFPISLDRVRYIQIGSAASYLQMSY